MTLGHCVGENVSNKHQTTGSAVGLVLASFLRSWRKIATHVARRKTVMCLGDSLTEQGYNPETHGWVAGLSDRYGRTVDVINRGFSGYNSRWIRRMLPRIMPSSGTFTPDILVVLLGSNDCTLSPDPQHIPLIEFRQNIENIVAHALTINNEVRIVLVTPPPLDEAAWEATARTKYGNTRNPRNRLAAHVNWYAEAVREVSRSRNVALADLWHGGNKIEYSDLSDGLHLGRSGNQKLLECVVAAITHHYPDVAPGSSIPLHFPYWANLCHPDWADAIDSWDW
eukprot:c8220_g1_i2.p1 GENE.c8220_g1_i2~~c8220_g1_i2.p1  ORF type:complete len:328 (-),score=47.32 c8220_g1_i2:71-916(-)